MFKSLVRTFFSSRNDREIRRISGIVEAVNALEESFSRMSDEEICSQTVKFRARLSEGATLDEILPEAFAVVREAGRRVLGMRHFDVQIMGGVILHEGRIAEMKTGEGKTLVGTLPVYLNALEGKGVHVVTVNDYLAKRDSAWMGELYRFLGMSVGLIQHDMPDDLRQKAYACDITYGTNNEFGFDYLRDNMKYEIDQFVQRELNFAIVDEVDSILIDEARTPLIISGPSEESTDLYEKVDRIIPELRKGDHFTVDEKHKTVSMTEEGSDLVESLLGVGNLYELRNISYVHHLMQAIKAHHLYKRDVDYVVKNGEVIIVDEFTGRLMTGRRWGEGLHQAVEAKERVKIQMENQTLATVTFQNYFRMYKKLSGMTGTADTEATEFHKIYNLEVIVVPPHRKMIRVDLPDQIYRSQKEKYDAVVNDIVERHAVGQPVLVGTVSIEKSEYISRLLKEKNIPHEVLNAKFHEKEAEIVAQAGRLGKVTIATNMAGRGTDILLGGNAEYICKAQIRSRGESITDEEREKLLLELEESFRKERDEVVRQGGLHIIGTERHESRRVDNQLRGRAGRQGDPGSSRFYLSLEDDLMRIFGADKIKGLMERMGVEEGVPIEHAFVTKAIQNAQKKVEAYHFDIRKQLIEYDDVMNQQRLIFYELRKRVLRAEALRDLVLEWGSHVVEEQIMAVIPENAYPESFDLPGVVSLVAEKTGLVLQVDELKDLGIDALAEHVIARYEGYLAGREKEFGAEPFNAIIRYVTLQTLDNLWKDHLLKIDRLKEGIGLRGYGQKDPLVEYKREGFDLFESFVGEVRENVIQILGTVREATEPEVIESPPPLESLDYSYPDEMGVPVWENEPSTHSLWGGIPVGEAVAREEMSPPRKEQKIGRNDPCPCGSGKKYKKCHGAD
ncbi:MAG: preprotein translocase subunit SecA [Nitrospirae bacterium]|nr:preprotein translocase subunit SecA [Nitrospirota bacterium]